MQILRHAAFAWLFGVIAAVGAAAGEDAVRMDCAVTLPDDAARPKDIDGPWRLIFDSLEREALRCVDDDEADSDLLRPNEIGRYWLILDDIEAPAGVDFEVCIGDATGLCSRRRIPGAELARASSYLSPPIDRLDSGDFPIITVFPIGDDAAGVRFTIRRLLRARTVSELRGYTTLPLGDSSAFVSILDMRGNWEYGKLFERLAEATGQLYWSDWGPFDGDLTLRGDLSPCTGTLVGPRHVLTNAHCMVGSDCAGAYFRFDNFRPNQFSGAAEVACKSVLLVGDPDRANRYDFALIELEETAPPVRRGDYEYFDADGDQRPRRWIDLASAHVSPDDAASDNIFIVHHPLGQPLMAEVCNLRLSQTATLFRAMREHGTSGLDDAESTKNLLAHNCDTRGGSSGALLFARVNDTKTPLKAVALHFGSYERMAKRNGQTVNIGVTKQQLEQDYGIGASNIAIDLESLRPHLVACIIAGDCRVD